MRKQEKAIIWPAYFDVANTRKNGRRVVKTLAVPSPKIEELLIAVKEIGLKNEITPDTSYPKKPWQKTGSILVEKRKSKEKTINEIAKQLAKIRNEAKIKK